MTIKTDRQVSICLWAYLNGPVQCMGCFPFCVITIVVVVCVVVVVVVVVVVSDGAKSTFLLLFSLFGGEKEDEDDAANPRHGIMFLSTLFFQ